MELFLNLQGIAKYREELKELYTRLEDVKREFNSIKNRKDELYIKAYSNALDKLSIEIEHLQKSFMDNYEFIKLAETEYYKLSKIGISAMPCDKNKNDIASKFNSAAKSRLLDFFGNSKCRKSYLPAITFENTAVMTSSDLFINKGGIIPDWIMRKLDSKGGETGSAENQTYIRLDRSSDSYYEAINEVFGREKTLDNTSFTIKVMDSMKAKIDFITDEKFRYLLESVGKDYGWFPMDSDEIRNFADSGVPSIAVIKASDLGDILYTVPPVEDKRTNEIYVYDVSEKSALKNVKLLNPENNSSIKYYVHR